MIARLLAAGIGAALLYLAATVTEGFLRASVVVARQARRTPLRLSPSDVSAEQLRVLLTVEDPRFFSHHGVDFFTPGAGMTTITQAVVKFVYFKPFHPGVMKIRQTLLAIGFDARIDKRTQLALFLNAGYFGTYNGHEVRGFEDAAGTYFHRDFASLTRQQYLSLVAMCVGPDKYSVATHRQENAERIARIERLLRGECQPKSWLEV